MQFLLLSCNFQLVSSSSKGDVFHGGTCTAILFTFSVRGRELAESKPCWGQAEQYHTLNVHMLSCLYSTPGASLVTEKVWRFSVTK